MRWTEEVELVELVVRVRRAARHDLLEEDVGRDEDERGAERAEDAEPARGGHVECAGEHDADGEREEGEVRLWRVAHAEEKGVRGDCEQRGESLRE